MNQDNSIVFNNFNFGIPKDSKSLQTIQSILKAKGEQSSYQPNSFPEEISIFSLNKENAKNEQAKQKTKKRKVLTEFSEDTDKSDIFEDFSRKKLKLQ